MDDSFDSFRKNVEEDEQDFFLVRKSKNSPGFFGQQSYTNPLFFTMAIVFCMLGVICQGGWLE